jgi:hypothetical protein
VVEQLYDSGRIALFLDGLDEMPVGLRSKALEQLSGNAIDHRVVITSRREEFVGAGLQLSNAAVVELQPVGPKGAARYLRHGQIGKARQVWKDIARHLRAHPDGVLARTLNTPLTLSLARSAYLGRDPRELLTAELPDEGTVRNRLLDQFLVAAYPDPRKRAHATYWLGWTAHQMHTQADGPTRDLCWWDIPSWLARQTQFGGALVGAVVGGLVGGLVGAFLGALLGVLWVIVGVLLGVGLGIGLGGGLGGGLVSGLVSGLVVGPVVGHSLGERIGSPRLMAFRRPTWQELRYGFEGRLWLALNLGLAVMFMCGIVGGPLVGVVAGLLAGFVFGLTGGLLWLLNDFWSVPIAGSGDVTPRSVYRIDAQTQLISGVVIGIRGGLLSALFFGLIGVVVVGLISVLVGGLSSKFGIIIVYWLAVVLWVGLVSWLGVVVAITVVGGLIGGLGKGSAPLLFFTEIALVMQRRRVRFMTLLETALARQVLRQAGAFYQFRHADLQDRLAELYEAGIISDPAVSGNSAARG